MEYSYPESICIYKWPIIDPFSFYSNACARDRQLNDKTIETKKERYKTQIQKRLIARTTIVVECLFN